MTMRVLVDRHHADLLYSLQLLFEDRLGCELYTPVGIEWSDEGYWNFGRWTYGDDRLAQQFLVGPMAERFGSHLTPTPVTFDPAHPERPILTVTLDEFRALDDWAYIVASVPDNEAGFARLAKEVGAQYVVQVGNTGQHVSWELDPIALVSSEMPIRGRGVVYHQEFDSDGEFKFFDWPLFDDPKRITSFVNLMPLTECGPLMDKYRDAMPDFEWRSFGIDCPQGVIKPVERIAARMALSDFGWHDKPTGDGFGHVIHQWAAIGRPLIGHADHYRGKLAEPFWTPETSIDLGARSFDENVELIRDIAADPDRHAEMCHAIRATFDRIVDYEAEAERIADLLGIPVAVPA